MKNNTLKKFLFQVYRIITYPLRVLFWIITYPYKILRKVVYIFTTEPEDRPFSDVLASFANTNVRKNFWEQIFTLRFHLIRALFVFAICCLVSFFYLADIFNFLQTPLNNLTNSGLRISGPGDIFDIIPKVIFAGGAVLTMPYFFFEIYLYVVPGLKTVERKIGLILQVFFFIFLVTAIAVSYYLILPISLSSAISLTSRFGVYDWELSRYLSFVSVNLFL